MSDRLNAGPGRHGLSAREQQIMDLSDAGRTNKQIAAELGLGLRYIQSVVGRFAFAAVWSSQRRAEQRHREADQRYAAALAATGRSYA